MFQILKKLGVTILTSLSVLSCTGFVAVTATGCKPETDHPEVEITYEFNGETYAVDYKLYRNMYPHTVRHFIELTEEGFYNDTIIHNYQTNDWFTGGYSYDADDYASKVGNEGQMAEYFELPSLYGHSKEDAYSQLFADGKLSASVYSNRMYDKDGKEYVNSEDALPTLMGEFYNNINQEIEKGALTADYGCLKFFHYEKDTTQKVYVTPTDDQIILADYKRNSATSIFALQTGVSSSYSELNYTVFAQLKETDVFDSLVTAVKEYIEDKASDFYTSVKELRVDNNDIEVTFNVPKQPIIVKTVKVTKY